MKLRLFLALIFTLINFPSSSRDTTGLSAQLTPELQEWTRGLRNSRGMGCCDDADGIDPVWEFHEGRYRVYYKETWLMVQPWALLDKKNRLGVARAWIGIGADGLPFVRCFLPGSMT